jgi:bifunctional UDP-N-acetylglucosamine pyrophosphorylase/glucosamine-1-phosphate N-acetyltransferase
MQVILLAAGQSTRLNPIQDKNLLEFAGKTLIEHRVAAIKNAKLRDIVVVGGKHNMEALKSCLKKFNNVVVVEQEKLADGMAGGVIAGAEVVKHKNIMVISANDVFDDDLFEKALTAAKSAEDGLIVGKRSDKYFPGGYLKVDKKNYITDIVEKPGEGKEPSNMINIVFHVYNNFPAFVSYLEKTKGNADDRYERALDTYIKKGKAKLTAFKYNGFWQPIKYPWHIIKLMNHYLENLEPKIDKTAKISKSAVINGNVYIGANVKVMDHAVIQGPAYIGDGSVVANNSLVRGSMIGKNCVVGFTTEVARSYLNHDVWMHTNYIGDSIVDHNVSFGAGTVLGNLRFDEETIKTYIKGKREDTGLTKFGAVIGNGTRFGINSSTNPGIKIGRNVFVGAGVMVNEDITDDRIVLLESKWKVSVNNKKADVKARK